MCFSRYLILTSASHRRTWSVSGLVAINIFEMYKNIFTFYLKYFRFISIHIQYFHFFDIFSANTFFL